MPCTQTNQFENLEISCKLDHQGSTAGFYGTTPIAKPSAMTAADNTTLGVLYAITERDVVVNMRTRINEIETKLKALGLFT